MFAILFVIGLNYYVLDNNTFGHQTIFNFIICFLTYYVLEANNDVSIKSKKLCFVMGFLLAFILGLGNIVYKYNDISILFTSKRTLFLTIFEYLLEYYNV